MEEAYSYVLQLPIGLHLAELLCTEHLGCNDDGYDDDNDDDHDDSNDDENNNDCDNNDDDDVMTVMM